MAIRINGSSNVIDLESAQQRLKSTFEKLTSGKRITRASVDASGMGIAQKLTALESAVRQGARNLNDGISVVRIADAALSETSNNLGRMRELAVQAQNGTLSSDQQAALQQEYDALASEVSRTAESTEFNDKQLLNGDLEGAGAIELEDGVASADTEVAVSDQSAQALGVESLSITDPSALAAIDSAIQSVASSRASLGATEVRLESQVRSLQVAEENTAAARSRIEDADIASETALLTRDQILQQAGVATQIQARNLHAGAALRLLGE